MKINSKISVVIPTHNRLPVLLKALDFLASGRVLPYELILVDDGSEIPVEEPVRNKNLPFPILRIIRLSPGQGAPSARNIGADQVTGDIVVFMDDDVFAGPESLASHQNLHTEHPADNYGVMGRIFFDPDIPHSPLMRWLEKDGDFRSIANGDDGAFQAGLISANFSAKNSFLKRQSYLFDTSFPFNRNEDTEFGYRMVSSADWRIHYHIGPSAAHHSLLDIDTYFRQVYQGGICKSHWSLRDPNATQHALNFGASLLMKIREQAFSQTFDQVLESYIKILNCDDIQMNDVQSRDFDSFMRFSRRAVQDIGQYDGWLALNCSLEQMAIPLHQAFCARTQAQRLACLNTAYCCDPLFFPLAWLYAEQLCRVKQWDKASRILALFPDNNWAMLLRCSCEISLRNYPQARALSEEALGRTNAQTPPMIRQKEIAGRLLETIEAIENGDDSRGDSVISWIETWRDGLKRKISWAPEHCDMKVLDGPLRNLFDIMDNTPESAETTLSRRYPGGCPVKPANVGTITWFTPLKGFGFIQPVRGNKSLIFHHQNVDPTITPLLRPGLHVHYTPTETQLGCEAVDVRIIDPEMHNSKDTEPVSTPSQNISTRPKTPHVAFLGFNNAVSFSGGRYHVWLMAEAAAEMNWNVSYITNCRPSFYDEFDNPALFPRHKEIRMHLTSLDAKSLSALDCGSIDILFVVPHGEGNDHVYAAALAFARQRSARIVLLNFETANWFNALSPVKRSEAAWWDGWRKIAEEAAMILSLTAEGTGYAREFYTKHRPRVLFEHCWPALNTRIADTVPDLPKERRILILTRFARAEHKGGNLVTDLLCEAMRGYTIVFIVGIGTPDNEYLAPIRRRAMELGIGVEILGRVTEEEKWREFKRASLVLFPSYFEGFGLPPVEAQYACTPCVAFDLPVLREVSGDGICYVPTGDTSAMREEITRVLENPAVRDDLREHLGEVMKFENFVQRVDALLKRALYEGPSPSVIMR